MSTRPAGLPRIVHWLAGFRFAARVQRQVELLAADQLAVADPSRRVPLHADDAVDDRQLFDRHRQAVGGQTQQRLARRRAGLREVGLVEVGRRRLAAGGRSLIGRDRGVALNQRDARERNGQLLGDQLHLHREDALPQLALAGVGGDAAVGADGEPRVELPGDALVLGRERPLRERELVGAGGEAAEADDQRAAALQEVAARRRSRLIFVSRLSAHASAGRRDVASDRAEHARVREAAAQHRRHRLLDLRRRSAAGSDRRRPWR